MNSSLLFKQFGSALNWNAYYYVVHQTLYTLRTVFLYRVLSTQDFSTWATINSTIFLILLWADCGLRKSIPRYAPLFYNSRQWFFDSMIWLQLIILTLVFPFILWSLCHITTDCALIFIGVGIFIAEGIQNIIRLMYHAYFDNRSFNSMAMICTSVEMVLTVSLILLTHSSYHLLISILTIKLISSWLLVLLSSRFIHYQPDQTEQSSIERSALKPFLIHSGMMWGTTVLKSLSERNFLVPLVTHMIGPVSGNLFKVANDTALVSYRLILKTVGSADTALLAHVHTHMHQGGDQNLMRIAVKKIISKIARLCFPVLGILAVVALYKFRLWYITPFVFYAFLIMAIGYLLETTLLPYERVLEVQRNYVAIIICYIPYVCMLGILITGTLITSIGFINMLICIHGVRLVSCIMMRYAVHYLYDI